MKKIGVFGGGSWGRALAFALSFHNEVRICSRRSLNLSSGKYPVIQASLEDVLECDYYVVAIASFALRGWLGDVFLPTFLKSSTHEPKILCASKGVEEDSGAFVSDIFQHFFPSLSLCFLSGPSFAAEIMQELPCALVINSLNIPLAREFRELMPSFIKAYVSSDIVGGEVAGAYKNVIAIAGGISDGLGLGNNAKSSLLARGLIEMCRFGEHFGAKMETFLGLSGAGDLFLTSSSTLSRNYRVGLGLSRGEKIEKILKDLGEVAEGVRSARAISQISQKEGIYTPIVTEVQKIIEGKNPLESLKALMK
ncbi:NAD(P)H-dependent glycerol-3-phosphate dehydrogenase [Helicobacter kayseriensis]|uniref:NAD(P)H-dependent glycerol-3-phosphate dehydrogenase n=1 Tax=Helicobacter kayseriensis TaxID=2905877 RepID=UPI001E5E8693|nr:NAD(P)H-dependent glycerol-3-phosphate dehydrogenase [Helicobacter kayseriensis]MCE3047379.1 NAD(P)H-dependent glycerol-3-phosphate dehydrogenase [Helicobacter kayseriensis]MCE3048750.1 NAD(P)H-dependent glycerol-3-phosphate dehydrogenase [Helicobacter kayseriensis]